jgi:hypothetical protein
MSPPMAGLGLLPSEVVTMITVLLDDIQDLVSLARVSRRASICVESDLAFWCRSRQWDYRSDRFLSATAGYLAFRRDGESFGELHPGVGRPFSLLCCYSSRE